MLAFLTLAYQTVPVSVTQTIIQQSTETRVSYQPYMATSILTYTTTEAFVVSTYPGFYLSSGCWLYCQLTIYTIYFYRTATEVVQSNYYAQSTSTISHTETSTSSITQTSTKLVPASESLGLSTAILPVVAMVVTGFLLVATALILHTNRTKTQDLERTQKPSP